MSVQYLVTGAAGQLGNTVVQALLREGKRVRALVLACDANAPQLAGAEVFVGDVCDKHTLQGFFSLPEGDEAIVIHSAGIVSIDTRFHRSLYKVNVWGTRNIVELCVAHKVKKLVHVSSVHAIAESPDHSPIAETDKFDPRKVIGFYAKTKAIATGIVLRAAKRGLNASVVHPSGIIGPNDYGHGYMTQLFIEYCRGTLLAGVNGGYDFVDVRDVAQGVLSCCERGQKGECYILSNRYCSVKELLSYMQLASGKQKIRCMLPAWFAKGTAPLAEAYYALRKQPPLFTPYSLYTLFSDVRFTHEKATRQLGFNPRPLQETAADTLFWLKEQNRVKY